MNAKGCTGNENSKNESGLGLVPNGFKHNKKLFYQNMNSSIWFSEPNQPGSHWHLRIDGTNNDNPFYLHDHSEEVQKRSFAICCVCDSLN